jgi:hypothetical protein
MWLRGPQRSFGVVVSIAALSSGTAHAEVIPVLTVSAGARPAHAAQDLAAIVAGLGSDALSGAALVETIEERFATRDRPGDTLREVRERIARSRRAYSDAVAMDQREVADALLRSLEVDAATIAAQPLALDRARENREALVSAWLFVANVTSADHPSRSNEAVRRLAETLPDLALSHRVASEVVRAAYREAVRPLATASLNVQSAPEGCQVRRNGVVFGNAPAQLQGLVPGQHRVAIRCGGRTSLLHRVSVGAGTTSTVQVDMVLDRALDLEGTPGFRYEDARVLDARMASDVATLGGALGVDRIVVYRPEPRRIVVVDVLSRTVVRSLDPAQWPALRGTLSGPPPPERPPAPPAATPAARPTIAPAATVAARAAANHSRTMIQVSRDEGPRRTGSVLAGTGLAITLGGVGCWLGANAQGDRALRFGDAGETTGAARLALTATESALRAAAIGSWIGGFVLIGTGSALMGAHRTQARSTTVAWTGSGLSVEGRF